MNDYWTRRAAQQSRNLYDKTLKETEKELARNYMISLKSVEDDISRLYDKLANEEVISVNDLYRYDRFIKLQSKLNKQLSKLAKQEVKIMDDKYFYMGKKVSWTIEKEAPNTLMKSFVVLDDNKVKEIVNNVWCNDGKHWSNRIWENKTELQKAIEKGLIDSISRGLPKDELVKTLKNNFNASFSNADRITRTELAHIQNTTTKESYKKAGIQYVQTIVSDDERLCDECSQHDGKITPISEAREGVAYLFHPNCRCDIVPIIE